MRALICFLTFITCAFTGLIKSPPHYFRGGNNKEFTKFMIIQDDEGKKELIDLQQAPVSVDVEQSDVKYYLFTQLNSNEPYEIISGNVSLLDDSNFNPEKKSVFIIHGWHSRNTSSVNVVVRPAVLENNDVNIFVVDWSNIAKEIYLIAQSSVVQVGEIIGEFVNSIQDKYKITGAQFIIIGHSLGGHVAGCTGAVITDKVSLIVGFDPAGPLFMESNPDNRLDPTDANFVHVIHSGTIFYGFAGRLGHADYYPNGGVTQPGCDIEDIVTCSHHRSYEYYTESLVRGNVFPAVYCEDYDTYSSGKCSGNIQSPMGLFEVDTQASGKYFLTTNSQPPYGQG